MRSSWNNRKIPNAVQEFVRLCLLLLSCMVVMRPIFGLEVLARLGALPKLFPTVLSGALFDLLVVGRIFVFGLLPFVLLHCFFPKLARGIFVGLIVLYVVVSALLSEYYCNLTMPLDHVILVYTMEELKETLFSSASFSWTPLLWFLALVALPILLVCLWRRLKVGKWLAVCVALVFLLLTLLVPYNSFIRENKLYATHEQFCLAVNQPSYASLKITDYLYELKKTGVSEDIGKAVVAYHQAHPEFNYDTPGYPFYRQANDPDVLSPFFDRTADGTPPNFVFIIVEGMGRCLTGVYDAKVSFTPFVDSLASAGLYWPHALSTSARTFGVLPSVFVSAPHGRYGFTTPDNAIPRHNSLLLDLKRNGYTTSFFYGGDKSFDGIWSLMWANKVDYQFRADLTVVDSARYQLLKDNHRWGLDDRDLFQAAIRKKQSDTLQGPFADIYLTLTTHEPFLIEGIEPFEERVKAMVDAKPEISREERDNILKNINIFACYLYTDQSIRELFDYYAQRPDFHNTIFVITGDHRMAYLPIGTAIHSYNVPLILYSPLIRRPKTMSPIVSHLDITPSLNAYLHHEYDYDIDDHCHWLGTSFDTVAEFRGTRKLMFMLNNRDVVDYVSGDCLLSRNRLIQLDSVYVGSFLQDDERLQKLKKELEDFDQVSRMVVKEDLMMPHTLHP